MKMFRRISALALAIVMVCLFSASAFAAGNPVFSNGEDYGNYESASAHAEIYRYSSFGELSMSTYDAIGNYCSIDGSCRYYADGTTGAIRTLSGSESSSDTWGHTMSFGVGQEYCFAMINATYVFYADVCTQNGMQSYGPVTGVVYY